MHLLSRALLFGGAGNSKGPLLLFMISVLLWGYPMYLLKCIPLTWNLLRGSHYCFIYWNILMWISWIVANRRDPGYVPQNSDAYYRAIKQVCAISVKQSHEFKYFICPCCFRFRTSTSGRNGMSYCRDCVTAAGVSDPFGLNTAEFAIDASRISIIIVHLYTIALAYGTGTFDTSYICAVVRTLALSCLIFFNTLFLLSECGSSCSLCAWR